MKPRIVFLDEASVNIGDIDLRPLKDLGPYRGYRFTSPQKIGQRARSADIIITNKCVITESLLKKFSRVRLVCLSATGVNNVDLDAALGRGIAITNVRAYSTDSVGEHTIMLMLALGRRLSEHHNAVVFGRWSHSPLFTLLDFPFSDLKGKMLGLIGYGRIGRRVSHLARAFGMKVLIARIPGRRYSQSPKRISLDQLLAQADFISLHCPLSPLTRQLINKKRLHLMKPSAFLVNLARGPIVDETALVAALKQKRLAGFATDVLCQEPPSQAHPLLQKGLRHKVLITPHIAWAAQPSRQRLVQEIALNIESFLQGKKRNRVV